MEAQKARLLQTIQALVQDLLLLGRERHPRLAHNSADGLSRQTCIWVVVFHPSFVNLTLVIDVVPMVEHFMKLIDLLLVELALLHQLIHRLLFRLLVQRMQLACKLDKLPEANFSTVILGDLRSTGLTRPMPSSVEPLQKDLAVLL